MRSFAPALAVMLSVLGSGCDDGVLLIHPEFEHAYGFESGLEGWTPVGADLGSPEVDWSVGPSAEQARQGTQSARYHLVNANGASKVWLERSFAVEPNQAYDVEIAFDLASADFGEANLWRVIAGAHPLPPRSADELTFRGDTGNGADTDVGHRWIERRYTARATSTSQGRLHAAIGFWGTWETARTYYVDNLRLVFTRVD